MLPVDLQVNGHGAVVDVVLIGIREQVGDDAAHLVLVEVDFDGLLRKVEYEFHLLGRGIVGESLCGLAHEADDVASLQMQFLHAHVEPAKVEQFHDEVVQLAGIAPGHVDLGADGSRQRGLADFLERGHHQRERCLQVVADVGEEPDFLFLHLVFLQVQFQLADGVFTLLPVAQGFIDDIAQGGQQQQIEQDCRKRKP